MSEKKKYTSHQFERAVRRSLQRSRMEFKEKENAGKPAISTIPDIVETSDFTLSRFEQEREGDSGRLAVAKRKGNRSEAYIIKSEYSDCACNEFMAAKIHQAMGCATLDTKLFHLSEGEKRMEYLLSEQIVGTRYINATMFRGGFKEAREQAVNADDLYDFIALAIILEEQDGVEVLYSTDDHKLYRIDASGCFSVMEMLCQGIGVDFPIPTLEDGTTFHESSSEYFLKSVPSAERLYNHILIGLKAYGKMDDDQTRFKKHFAESLKKFIAIEESYIDDACNTMCYIYPDVFGVRYKRYIAAVKEACKQYLANNGMN